MPIPPLELIKEEQKKALEELIEFAGTQRHLAKMIGVPLGTVKSWISYGRISMRGAELAQKNPFIKERFPLDKLRPEIKY